MAQELSRLDGLAQVVSLDAKHLTKDLRSRLEDISSLFACHVPQALQMLTKLLDGHILCEPIMEGGKAGYRFTATATFDRLLTGENIVNERWWRAGELNPRPLRCERSALPTELAPHSTDIQPVRRMLHRPSHYTQPFPESLPEGRFATPL